jgi:hypothetical protein
MAGHRAAVAAPHIAAQGRPQRGRVGEGAAGQHLALQGAEPVLDRVQPGRIVGGEVEVIAKFKAALMERQIAGTLDWAEDLFESPEYALNHLCQYFEAEG